MSDIQEKLAPCPFCGSANVASQADDRFEEFCYYGGCNDCGAEGPNANNEREAIEGWNRRAPVEPAAEGLRKAFREGWDACPGLPWNPNTAQITEHCRFRDAEALRRYPDAALAAQEREEEKGNG